MNDNELDGHDSPQEQAREAQVLHRFPKLKQFRRYLLWIAIIMIILGTIGLGETALLSITSVLLFGVLLLIGGVLIIFRATKSDEPLWAALNGLLYLIAGGLIIYDPIGSTLVLTWLIGGFLMASGVMRSVYAFRLRPTAGWGLLLLSGALSIILGIILFSAGIQDLWFIGLMIALELLFDGFGLLFIALALKDNKN